MKEIHIRDIKVKSKRGSIISAVCGYEYTCDRPCR